MLAAHPLFALLVSNSEDVLDSSTKLFLVVVDSNCDDDDDDDDGKTGIVRTATKAEVPVPFSNDNAKSANKRLLLLLLLLLEHMVIVFMVVSSAWMLRCVFFMLAVLYGSLLYCTLAVAKKHCSGRPRHRYDQKNKSPRRPLLDSHYQR